ncbi:hypothetical protein JCM10135_12830 [Stetteria hydrogenophila]
MWVAGVAEGWRLVIPRLVYRVVERAGSVEVGAPQALLGGGGSWRVDVYRVAFGGLIVQEPSGLEVSLYTGPVSAAPGPWREYCRWHSGPLDERDRPWERIYCNVEVRGGLGFCRQHRRSERALYEACTSLRGGEGLEACKLLDRAVRAEYAVYMLDHGGAKPKVGMTRAWRVVDRVAEQPHVVATVLAVYDSAYEARRAEVTVSRLGIAGEQGPRGRRRWGPPEPVAPAAARLESFAGRAARALGVEWEGRLFRVEPPWGRGSWPVHVAPERLSGVEAAPEGFWGGMLALRAGGRLVGVDERRLVHRLSLLAREGG